MGETIAVALVIGSTAQITTHVFLPGDAMAAVIANQFGEAGALHKSALIGLGVVLFVITILDQRGRPRHRHPPRPPHPGGLRCLISTSTSAATRRPGEPHDRADLRRSRSRQFLLEVTTSRGRRIRNGLATMWMYGAFVVAVIPLGFIIFYVVQKGLPQVMTQGWFTRDITAQTRFGRRRHGPGHRRHAAHHPRRHASWRCRSACSAPSTSTSTAAGVAWPALIRFMADVMTGVPSIVMGLFIYTIYTLVFGLNGFGGSLALACLMLPIVIRSTEEMLRLVPDELRNGSYALGNRKWRTIVTVVLPAAHRRHRQRDHAGRRPRRRRDRAAAVHHRRRPQASTSTCSTGPTPPCRCRSSPTPRRRSRPRRTGPGAPRSR